VSDALFVLRVWDMSWRDEYWIKSTSVRDRNGKLVTVYFCQGPNRKTGYKLLLSGTELENCLKGTFVRNRTGTLQGTSVRDRPGKLVTRNFS
jgi:hypothetical protein